MNSLRQFFLRKKSNTNIPGFNTATWSGLYVPSATPKPVVQHVHASVDRIQKSPEFQKNMLAKGIDQSPADTPEKHAAFVQSEIQRWGKVIREAGVRVE